MSFKSSLITSPSLIKSISSLLSLLSSPLQSLKLLPPSTEPSSSSLPPSPNNRQIQLVQLSLLNHIWLTWVPAAAEPEESRQLQFLLKRWFIPPLSASGEHARLVISTIELLVGFISGSTYTGSEGREGKKQPPKTKEQLLLAAGLLAELVLDTWKIAEVYNGLGGEEEEERWEDCMTLLGKIPAVVANAFGKPGWSRDMDDERLLDMRYFPLLSQQYVDLLLILSATSTLPTHTTNLIPPLLLLTPYSASLLASLIPFLLPPSTTSITPSAELISRKNLANLWLRIISGLPRTKLERIGREVVGVVGRWVTGGAESERMERIEGGGWLLWTLVGPTFHEAKTPSHDDEDDEEDDSSSTDFSLQTILLDPRASTYTPSLALAIVRWSQRSQPEVLEAIPNGDKSSTEVSVGQKLLDLVAQCWCNVEGIKNGNQGFRIYISTLLIALLASLPPTSALQLSRSPSFLTSIGTHLNLTSNKRSTRLLGMMVAEEVSRLSPLSQPPLKGKEPLPKLSFGEVWDDEDDEDVKLVQGVRKFCFLLSGKLGGGDKKWQELLRTAWWRIEPPKPAPQNRRLPLLANPQSSTVVAPPPKRSLIVEINEDPDDLQPFSLPTPPSASVLEALETPDPSLYATLLPRTSAAATTTRRRGNLRPPVYIPELTEYLRGKDPEGGKEDAEEESERVKVGLEEGAGLVRRKKGWGGEVEENATELAGVLVGLQDQFETEGFEKLKLEILIALVVACPTRVAPNLIEHYYMPNYTLIQRHAILTALALGARELAGLPPPPTLNSIASNTSPPSPPSTLFPSKRLPPALHARLISSNISSQPSTSSPLALPAGALESITTNLTNAALSSAKVEAEETIPEARREKLLTIRRFASALRPTTTDDFTSKTSYASIATESFIMPLINRLFLHLRDLSTSPRSKNPYAGGNSGTALLDVLLLPAYLGTLSVLLHAARHSPYFLGVLAPEAMELVFVLRSVGGGGDDEDEGGEVEEKVLQSEMELLLVVLDASVSLDGGTTLMRARGASEGGKIVSEAREWAEEVFEREEKKPGGIGGAGRAAAGVLLRVEEILSKWRGRVGW